MNRRKLIKDAEARIIPVTVVIMLIITTFTGMFLIGPLHIPTTKAAGSDEFTYYKDITVNHLQVEAAHTNMVLWVYNVSSDFANACQADGDDIAFYSEDGLTQYKHEVEQWDSETGTIGCWVNISEEINDDTDFVFRVYYGDADGTNQQDMDGTWDAKYSSVWHMNSSASPIYDSSGNGHTMAETGSATYEQTGLMNYSINASDDYWTHADDSDFDVGLGEFTILCWFKPDATATSNTNAFFAKTETSGYRLQVYLTAAGLATFVVDDDGTAKQCDGTTNLSDWEWHQIVAVRENNVSASDDHIFLQVDKDVEDRDNIGDYGSLDNNDHLIFGERQATGGFNVHGEIDEFWFIKGVAMNSSWVNTTYNNQYSPDTFFTFGDEEEDEEVPNWGNWSDTWTISTGHTCTESGYEYGNWSHSEHVNDSSFDEDWSQANYSHWYVNDSSDWWGGEDTMAINTTGINHSFAVLNNSGLNRVQGAGWVHLNDTETGLIFPYIIFAYNSSIDYDLIMWSVNELWALHWNGTNMTDVATGDAVIDPSADATDISDQWVQFGVYLEETGMYYKYIYNELNGSIRFKWWDGSSSPYYEPDGWATEYTHANLTHSTVRCQGIGMWNPDGRDDAVMQYDLMNIWQLNYTTNDSAYCNISDYNESRPHMDFPVIDIGNWSEDTMQYFNDTFDGNITADSVRDVMKDNITNLMNMESRMFIMDTIESGDQNDTIYYYSCMLDNFTGYNPGAEYDEWLHLHVQMCPEDEIDVAEYCDMMVAIDVDNNYAWDANDRIFWTWTDDDDASTTKLEYNGNGVGIPATYGSTIWTSDRNAIGNLHRYETQVNYVINIPLGDLIKSNGYAINASDVFGLHIVTTTSSATSATQIPAVWQNWNETNEQTFWTETDFASAMTYFTNGCGEAEVEEDLPNATHIGRWGEGVISGGYGDSGDIAYNMSIEAYFNDTSSGSDETYALINTTIYVNNTGAGNLNGIWLNVTWWNCSCSDLNATFVDSNQDISNFTWFNDSCYLWIHNASNEPLAGGLSWTVWFIINVTNCSGTSSANETMNITGNATELASDVDVSSAPWFRFGTSVSRLCIGYTTDMTDVGSVGNTVFNVIGVIFIISAVLMIMYVVQKFRYGKQ